VDHTARRARPRAERRWTVLVHHRELRKAYFQCHRPCTAVTPPLPPRFGGGHHHPSGLERCITGAVRVLADSGSDLGLGDGPSPVGSKPPPWLYLSHSPPPSPSGCL